MIYCFCSWLLPLYFMIILFLSLLKINGQSCTVPVLFSFCENRHLYALFDSTSFIWTHDLENVVLKRNTAEWGCFQLSLRIINTRSGSVQLLSLSPVLTEENNDKDTTSGSPLAARSYRLLDPGKASLYVLLVVVMGDRTLGTLAFDLTLCWWS